MADKTYAPVADGWKNLVKPCFVEVKQDYFNENSLIVEMAFNFGDEFERPKAKLPLVYASDHVITKWEDGKKSEHKATLDDQREAYRFLMALFPAWKEFCKESHANEEKIYWFENDGRDVVLGTEMDIQVKHSSKGFPNAYVKDPAHIKPKKEKTTAAAAVQRFADTFGSMIADSVVAGTKDADDNGIPF